MVSIFPVNSLMCTTSPSVVPAEVWLPLPAASQPYALRLARAGWLVREGEVFGIRTPSHGLRLSLGRLSDAEISRLAADIAQALDAP